MIRYKQIVCFQYYGGWNADCIENGKRYALHRVDARTKADAYAIAKQEVDYLNNYRAACKTEGTA